MDGKSNEIDNKTQGEVAGLEEGSSLDDELVEGEQQGKNSQREETGESDQTAELSPDEDADDDLGSSNEGETTSDGGLEPLEVELVVQGNAAIVTGGDHQRYRYPQRLHALTAKPPDQTPKPVMSSDFLDSESIDFLDSESS